MVNLTLIFGRGEQFRHLQNVNNSRAHLVVSRNYNTPTLPIRLSTTENYALDSNPTPTALPTSWSGPPPPKSWKSSQSSGNRNTPQWRNEALRVVLSHYEEGNKVPSLSLLCLQVILASYTNSNNGQFRAEIVPYIPEHLRRGLIRHCAVHEPLSSWMLKAMYEPQGHADGEILVVGPDATLKDDHFSSLTNTSQHLAKSVQSLSIEEKHGLIENDWEDDELHPYQPIHTVALLSTPMSSSALLTLPATMVNLALIDLPVAVPIHRLPKLCPLIVTLDLSFNSWLVEGQSEGQTNLERIEWTRWSDLKVVALRDCFVSEGLMRKINKGRWDDVDVVR